MELEKQTMTDADLLKLWNEAFKPSESAWSGVVRFAELVRQDERVLSLELAGVLRELLELEGQGRHADDISIEVWERAQRAFYGWKGGE